ncbi:Alpha/beta hydrolase fold-3 [Kalmanozyma brasiliensis GHG001]|uniref:Alpha/beta hydrolase fold-3 domain-containing protein n=1 Tax=Kalmanozyma brasiliensis (strain GHG001) TaxID=1365824 RepID=V5GP58_KALBG|nr:Alpha/beta hydrolase fold-3 [Kalmanozyma brasiliensis GHG001]EST07742.1 Alpha/beta hydrolase fold-3 [Kalmanozyma brasiliensis GHG001]
MTITTAGVAVNLTPTVTKTFFKHYYKKAKRSFKARRNDAALPHNGQKATDEFMFDEAFHIVKAFIEIGTSDTVEAIQDFTDAPAPPIPWATTLPVMIPMESCDAAAKLIVEHLGPQDLAKLVGGEKWWQMRPLPGLQGEWIAMSNDWKKMKTMEKTHPKGGSTGSTGKQRRRRDKRHERALSEIRAMRQKTESALKRRSQSFKRVSQEAPRQRNTAAGPNAEDEVSPVTEDHVPQPQYDAAAEAHDEDGTHDHAAETEELDRLQRVMLYFHGGGYYFGSLATHRYQIVRYARKFGGKCFAPVYRKAPQYPWPCALQDAVASYLYLLYPPKGANHKPVDPKKLVIAGDSAGGGLTLALLTVIRDMGLPAPAGAVLISPWCDMTHSFPSILQNTDTDIIPPYGFIHKPSTLWPINATRPAKEKDDEATNEGDDEPRRRVPVGVDEKGKTKNDSDAEPAARKSFDGGALPSASKSSATNPPATKPSTKQTGIPSAPDLLWSDPINVNRADPTKEAIELREQIQLYATNDQVTHPLCSAVLSGSLGGLPPLYILAGDAEVLRDEIIYLAHRAAHPSRYPLRKDLLDHSARNRENAEKYDGTPTKVHLQVYDQMCHVLTAFAFTGQSRFAYRGVASFVKHVTGAPTDIRNPFPETREGEVGREGEGEGWEDGEGDSDDDGLSEVRSPEGGLSLQSSQVAASTAGTSTSGVNGLDGMSALSVRDGEGSGSKPSAINTDVATSNADQSDTPLRDEPEPISTTSPTHPAAVTTDTTTTRHRSMSKVLSDTLHGHPTGSGSNPRSRRATNDVANTYAGQVPLVRPSYQSFMIRERIDVRGFLRPLEPESALPALQLNPDDIGRIKEGPVERYLDGQAQWAKRFAKTARKVERQRAKNETTAQRMLEEAHTQGLLDVAGLERKREVLLRRTQESAGGVGVKGVDVARGAERCRDKWGWLCDVGPMDLVDETPPPAAIAGRRDTDDALVLLRRSLQIRARAYGVQRKSRFWGAEDRPVREHLRTEEETLNTETSTDPTGKSADPEGKGKEGKEVHHHRGLRVWNLLMVGSKPGSSKGEKHS